MYLLEAYNSSDKSQFADFIEKNNFADLVTFYNGAISSNKVPLYYDKNKNTLYGHFGKENPQLVDIKHTDEALVIFSGAHAYISPQWYESDNAVPTWNFQTLQVKGTPSLIDEKELVEILARLTNFHESQFLKPWTMNKLDKDMRKSMLQVLSGFKIEIKDIKFKEKMSQIRSTADQQSVVNALNQQKEVSAQKVAQIMQNNLDKMAKS